MNTKIEAERVYTLEEAAEYLKVSYTTIQRWVNRGTIPAFKVGRFWRVYGRDLLSLNKLGGPEEDQA
jgi:excisionase family DNA binding protein